MLHNRTVESGGQSEFRPGIETTRATIDMSGEFERQFYGDVMLFSVEKAARYMDVELECGKARVAANKTALDAARGPEYYRTPTAPAAAPAAAGRGRGAAQ